MVEGRDVRKRSAVWGPIEYELECEQCGEKFKATVRPLGNAVLCERCEKERGFE